MRARASLDIPMPVSRTSMRMSSPSVSASTRTVPPSGVNRMPFRTNWSIACVTSVRSSSA